MGWENGKNLISLYSAVYSECAMAHRLGQTFGKLKYRQALAIWRYCESTYTIVMPPSKPEWRTRAVA